MRPCSADVYGVAMRGVSPGSDMIPDGTWGHGQGALSVEMIGGERALKRTVTRVLESPTTTTSRDGGHRARRGGIRHPADWPRRIMENRVTAVVVQRSSPRPPPPPPAIPNRHGPIAKDPRGARDQPVEGVCEVGES